MGPDTFFKVLVGLLPVILFLGGLLYLDSFKLVRFQIVTQIILFGALVAVASYFANGHLIAALNMEFVNYTRFIAPIIEEALKGAILVYLVLSNRIGFLVDGAILGFAVGAGFAVAENIYYLFLVQDASLVVWIIRGLGTALMHGGVCAIFAVLAHLFTEKRTSSSPVPYLVALLVAAVLHSVFNQFPVSPVFSTIAVLLGLPLILFFIFARSTSVMHEWLEVDFDRNEELLQIIQAGEFTRSKAGRFLVELRERFDPLIMVDLLCYIRLHVELSIRAKSMLMAREYGMEVKTDQEIRDKFAELHALESNIGKSGMLAMRPYLNMSRKELWALFIFEK